MFSTTYGSRIRKRGRGESPPQRLELNAQALEVARADNQALAGAASSIVGAFVQMRERGWIDDETAVRLAFKFAGENLSQEQIDTILAGRDSSLRSE